MEIVRSSPFESSASTMATPLPAPSKRRILFFDREGEEAGVVASSLPVEAFELIYCRSQSEVDGLLKHACEIAEPFDVLIWSLSAPYEENLDALSRLRVGCQTDGPADEPRLVLLASHEALAFASVIKTINADALVLKPLHAADVRSGLERALRKPRLTEATRIHPALSSLPSASDLEPSHLVQEEERDIGRDLGLIGSSPEMKKVFSLIRRVGPSNVNVLITGESGSGKEMVATAIHRVSDRAKKPFIAINCAAIPRELLESELFGHAKGAFTGATAARRGLFEEAHEGTILLDEIGDLPLSLQAKILRLLQTRQVKPLGQNSIREVDVRIISATHKNLKMLIQKGEFREDLYYRLNVMPIHLPPLRERKDDILMLAEHFLRRFAERRRCVAPVLTKRACLKLQTLPWKGNVRELENVIERAIVLSDGKLITEGEVLAEEMEPVRETAEDLFNAGMTLKDIEREYIKYVLSRTGNRKEAATRILGIDRKTLYRKEKTYGIRPSNETLN